MLADVEEEGLLETDKGAEAVLVASVVGVEGVACDVEMEFVTDREDSGDCVADGAGEVGAAEMIEEDTIPVGVSDRLGATSVVVLYVVDIEEISELTGGKTGESVLWEICEVDTETTVELTGGGIGRTTVAEGDGIELGAIEVSTVVDTPTELPC